MCLAMPAVWRCQQEIAHDTGHGHDKGGAGGGVYPAQSCCGVMCLAMPARKFYTKLAMCMTRGAGGGGGGGGQGGGEGEGGRAAAGEGGMTGGREGGREGAEGGREGGKEVLVLCCFPCMHMGATAELTSTSVIP